MPLSSHPLGQMSHILRLWRKRRMKNLYVTITQNNSNIPFNELMNGVVCQLVGNLATRRYCKTIGYNGNQCKQCSITYCCPHTPGYNTEGG